jgi:single-strand DNA-binding protein
MNSISIAGNIARDAEVRYLPNGDAVAGFSVADNMGKDKGAIFWSCSLFGKRAESLAPYLTKGQAVTVTGTVSEREWTDKDGQKRKSMDVRVNDVALQGGKREGEAPRSKPAAKSQAAPAGGDGFDDLADDIPF